jgi:hypothetical protein
MVHTFFTGARDSDAMKPDLLEQRADLNATILTVDGSRTRDEVAEGIGRLIERFQSQPTRNLIVDIREAVYDQPITDIIKDWSLVAALLPRAKVALVYCNQTVTPALATVGALEASHHEAEAFASLDEAISWIKSSQAA